MRRAVLAIAVVSLFGLAPEAQANVEPYIIGGSAVGHGAMSETVRWTGRIGYVATT